MSITTHNQPADAHTDHCPGPELMWDAADAAAVRDLIQRAIPESTTLCVHEPGQRCPFVTLWNIRQAASLDDLPTSDALDAMTLDDVARYASERAVPASAVIRAIEDRERDTLRVEAASSKRAPR